MSCRQMKQTEENGAKYLHFDVMDGMFVPSISFGVPVLKSIKGATNQVMDVHLMVQEPIRYVKDLHRPEQISSPSTWKRVLMWEIRFERLKPVEKRQGFPSVLRRRRRSSCHIWI